jgi:hypothetical protein
MDTMVYESLSTWHSVPAAASGTDLPTPIADQEAMQEPLAEAPLLAAIFIWAQRELQSSSISTLITFRLST